MWNSIYSKIKKRIEGLPDGSVIAIADFADLAEPKTVSKDLTRLSEAGVIGKLMRGIFIKGNEDGAEPNPDEVAKALARNNSWQLVPSGETALHIIGAAEEEPDEWTYVTDGTNRQYRYGKYVINFRHASGKFLKSMSDKTALLVQVIKAWGQKPMTQEFVSKIMSFFSKADFSKIVAESRNTTNWIWNVIKSLFAKKHTGELA